MRAADPPAGGDPPQVVKPDAKDTGGGDAVRLEIHVQRAAWRRGYKTLTPQVVPLQNGDKVQLHLTLEEPAYVYLYWYDAQGQARRLHPKNLDDQKRASEVWDPPLDRRRDRQIWYRLGDPVGMEMAVAAASSVPLNAEDLATFERFRVQFVSESQEGQLVPVTLPKERRIVGQKKSRKAPRREEDTPPPTTMLILPPGSEKTLVALSPGNQESTERGLAGTVKARKVPRPEVMRDFETLLQRRFQTYSGLVFPHR